MNNDNIENVEVDTDNLVTVKSFAKLCDVSTAFIYKLQNVGEIKFVDVDGVHFVDKEKYKTFSDIKSTTQLLKSLKSLIKSKKNV